MNLKIRQTQTGYSIAYDGKEYPMSFPKNIWQAFPKGVKDIFTDNMAFMETIEMPVLLSEDTCEYNIPEPFLKSVYFKALLQHIPFSSDVDNKPAAERIKKCLKVSYQFSGPMRVPGKNFDTDERAAVLLTFGKDSMLSYALCKEIGLNPVAAAVFEGGLPVENSHRKKLIDRFNREFRANVHIIKDSTVPLGDYSHHGLKKTQFGYSNALSAYALVMLPLNSYYRARYTVLGNEQSCSDYYITKDGYRAFPVYDQSSMFTKQCDLITKAMSAGAVSTLSVIEPIHELAVMKILHSRYPKYAKYQMSCFPDDHKGGKSNRWCQHCSKCARMSIFCMALGIDLKNLGITEDMLSRDRAGLFSLFGSAKGDVSFDISGLGRDEQLFSFYLACKNGAKGYLIDRFRQTLLREAKSREDVLHKKFFGVHPSNTIPGKLLPALKSIYREELQ
ncbi:hypothetical protein HY638_01605 [Candidatus Woesearchaeota archaeon]|nr:hypothetical protein [Candidatus Woesearchaeota archaeon]